MPRRQFLRSAALSVGAWILVACGVGTETTTTIRAAGTTAATGPKGKVAFLHRGYFNARWGPGDEAGFLEEAKKLGLETLTQGSNDDEQVQATQVEQALIAGIDVLVLNAVNVDVAESMVRKAAEAGVPVISYNEIIDNVPLAAAVIRDNVTVGVDLATEVVKVAPKGNYVLVSGDEANTVAQQKLEGTMQVLQPSIDNGDITIVSQQFTRNWDPELARNQVEGALIANSNDIVAVVSQNDFMGFAAIAALDAEGLAGTIPVTGEDADTEALKRVQDGTMLVTNFTPFDEFGAIAARIADQIISGETLSGDYSLDNGAGEFPVYEQKPFNVTLDNLEEFANEYAWWAKPDELGL